MWLAALLCVLASIGLCTVGNLADHLGQMWIWCLVGLTGYALGAWCVRHTTRLPISVILSVAVIMRLALLTTEPTLSDDIYRYLWDGRVQNAGVNPYAYAPDDPSVSHLRHETWEQINHRQVPTVYPPLAQWMFAMVVGIGGGVLGLKVALLLCEAVVVYAVLGLLGFRRRDPGWILLYAWHPLPVLEIAGSGHVDALGVAALMASLLWVVRFRRGWAAVALGAAILSKLIPAMCAAAYWRHWQESGPWSWFDPRPRAPLMLTIGVVAAGYALFMTDGTDLFRGLQTYALKWRFNDGVFALAYEVLRDHSLKWDDGALLVARQVCAFLWFGILIWALRWRDPVRISFCLLGAYIVISPTVHPWYLIWVLPFLPLFPRPAWVVWSWTILLSYEVLTGYRLTGAWEPASWALWAQYGPFFLLLALELLRGWRRASVPPERSSASDV